MYLTKTDIYLTKTDISLIIIDQLLFYKKAKKLYQERNNHTFYIKKQRSARKSQSQ